MKTYLTKAGQLRQQAAEIQAQLDQNMYNGEWFDEMQAKVISLYREAKAWEDETSRQAAQKLQNPGAYGK